MNKWRSGTTATISETVSANQEGRARSPSGPSSTAAGRPGVGPFQNLERRQWRQLIVISVAAIAIYVTLRLLPTGTNLNHMDFRVQGTNSIEFCDPLNPQFVPVVAARSPVTLTVATETAAKAGSEIQGVLSLTTAGGKAIGPEDLMVVHDQKLHLMIVDPSLMDYQHVHPQPTGKGGVWRFVFTPRFGGAYRLFADFTPVATARSLYANTDLIVAGSAAAPGRPASVQTAAEGGRGPRATDLDGYRFVLTTSAWPIRARQPVDYKLEIHGKPGEAVPMQPIMGAFAHLVAFDDTRSGFAHLHPAQPDPLLPPDKIHPVLNFKLTIPTAGRYVIWSQVNLAGKEVFAPFWFDVVD